jgi:hypothetical protein
MNSDVLLSILALDTYNRGDGANVGGLSESGSIGTATIRPFKPGEQDGWAAAGFYAIAYNWNGQTVISYRGTNIVDNFPSLDDMVYGWSLGAAFNGPPRATANLDGLMPVRHAA